jgi:branched-chain amino acid transport system ATP-binding protein
LASDRLQINDLTVYYGDFLALDEVSMRVAPGEIVAVLGANGAGKTTLLKSISGVLRPRAGGIRLDGDDLVRMAPYKIARRGVSHLPEARGIFPDMTVEENLRLVAAYGRPTWETTSIDGLIDEALDAFEDLAEKRHHEAGSLSGGQQQMLTIARGVIMRPQLLLADELSFGLAPAIVDRALDALKRINERVGTSIVLVEQNVGKALLLADRAYVLRVGRKVAEGPADEFLADTRQLFTLMGVEVD